MITHFILTIASINLKLIIELNIIILFTILKQHAKKNNSLLSTYSTFSRRSFEMITQENGVAVLHDKDWHIVNSLKGK